MTGSFRPRALWSLKQPQVYRGRGSRRSHQIRAERLQENLSPARIIGAESKDPENASFTTPSQGVLTRTPSSHVAGLEDSFYVTVRALGVRCVPFLTRHDEIQAVRARGESPTAAWDRQFLGILRLRAHRSRQL